MRIILTERNYTASEKLKGIIDKKLAKLDKYFENNTDAHVTLTQEKLICIMEVTIPFSGTLLRAEHKGQDMYSIIDELVDRLEHQIHRHRTRLEKRLKGGAFADYELSPAQDEQYKYNIVRVKRFAVKPMDTEEAVMQMELLGHDFFVFTNSEANEVNVIYRRKDGNIGLIEPDYED